MDSVEEAEAEALEVAAVAAASAEAVVVTAAVEAEMAAEVNKPTLPLVLEIGNAPNSNAETQTSRGETNAINAKQPNQLEWEVMTMEEDVVAEVEALAAEAAVASVAVTVIVVAVAVASVEAVAAVALVVAAAVAASAEAVAVTAVADVALAEVAQCVEAAVAVTDIVPIKAPPRLRTALPSLAPPSITTLYYVFVSILGKKYLSVALLFFLDTKSQKMTLVLYYYTLQ